MLRSTLSQSSFSVQVKDHALVLFLPQPEQHSLWRFDMDTLTEQAFRVTGRDGYYFLNLDNLDGTSKNIARFLDKGQAHEVLDSLHQALIKTENVCHRKTFFQRAFGWLTFWRAVFLIGLLTSVWYAMQPVPQTLNRPVAAVRPMAPVQTVPTGIPLDADQMLE